MLFVWWLIKKYVDSIDFEGGWPRQKTSTVRSLGHSNELKVRPESGHMKMIVRHKLKEELESDRRRKK